MSAILIIQGLMPLLKAAADTIAAFTGNSDAARVDSLFTNATGVVNAVAPLINSFTQGMEVTEDDVRNALAGSDQAIADFDQAIAEAKARQDTTGTDG